MEDAMKNYVPSQCPFCEGELIITDMTCGSCHTHISGSFHTTRLSRLDSSQLEFVEAFIKCRGNIKEMERELKISYPTVKSRLEIVAQAMGFSEVKTDNEERIKILDSIEKGEMSIEE